MHEPELFVLFTRKFNELGLRYMVSGSIAAIYYGEPRMTNDVDIVLVLAREDVSRLVATFTSEQFYCPPQEVILQEQAREERGHFNLIHHETGFKADVYLAGREELHAWALDHVKVVALANDRICLAPPEYVILRKLQFFREGHAQKHLRDVQRMTIGLGEEWSRDSLLGLIQRFGLTAEWEQALSFEE